jgi:transposase
MDEMHEKVAGLDVHKETIVACIRVMADGKATRECRTFDTTTAGLQALLSWLTESGCTQVAMEATGVYWKPVWNQMLGDKGYDSKSVRDATRWQGRHPQHPRPGEYRALN